MQRDKVVDNYVNYITAAKKAEETFGRTPLYKFFDPKINELLGGGLAKPNATNIILVYGGTGVGKTLLTLNILASAIREKKRFGHILLEDDVEEIYNRFKRIVDKPSDIFKQYHALLGPEKTKEQFTQQEALNYLEWWYRDLGIDIIVLDHIQFMFESSADGSQDNEWIRQRKFVQEINALVKKYKRTLVLVSHVKKGADMSLDSTTGSNAIPQVATKTLAIYRNATGQLCLKQDKTRYTKPYFDEIPIRFDNRFRLQYDDGSRQEETN